MQNKIKVAIIGHGNLGRGVEYALQHCPDMELQGIYTRRAPSQVKAITPNAKIWKIEQAADNAKDIDVAILCGGSATDLPKQTPELCKLFHVVDSFDTHAKIPEHFEAVDKAAKESGHCAFISVGWDPGLFSLNRLYAQSILPQGSTYTFWGKGVSQGHSDAIRRVDGVAGGIQYTIPREEALNAVRTKGNPTLSTREKHLRECFVAAEEGADKAAIEKTIKEMPNYFSDYDTTVHFISGEELKKNHSKMPHGGVVMHSGVTGEGNKELIEFSLTLDSNPEFTSSVLTAFARAVVRMGQQGQSGAFTVFDVPPAMLSLKTGAELRKELL